MSVFRRRLMILQQSNSYVTDGLVLHYSGNTPPVNGVWQDISSRHNNGILINPNNTIRTVDNGVEFTNNADYITSVNNLGVFGDATFTLEVVCKFYGLQSSQANGGQLWWGVPAYANGISCIVDRQIVSVSCMDTDIRQSKGLRNTKYSAAFTKNAGIFNVSNALLYVNNDSTGCSMHGMARNLSLTNTKVQIGRAVQSYYLNRTFNGVIYAVRIYSRVLSQSELTQNYIADKKNYNF